MSTAQIYPYTIFQASQFRIYFHILVAHGGDTWQHFQDKFKLNVGQLSQQGLESANQRDIASAARHSTRKRNYLDTVLSRPYLQARFPSVSHKASIRLDVHTHAMSKEQRKDKMRKMKEDHRMEKEEAMRASGKKIRIRNRTKKKIDSGVPKPRPVSEKVIKLRKEAAKKNHKVIKNKKSHK